MGKETQRHRFFWRIYEVSQSAWKLNNKNQIYFLSKYLSLIFFLIFFKLFRGNVRRSSQAISKDSSIDRFSYRPWATNLLSNFSKNSKYNLSSAERASSPTTAFIAMTSFP